MECSERSAARVIARIVALSLGSYGIDAAANADPQYRITEISAGNTFVSYVYGPPLNASGQVTGYADFISSQVLHAFLWDANGKSLVDLGPFDSTGVPYGQSFGNALNASGHVTGYVYPGGNTYAFLWKNDGTPLINLGTLGGSFSEGLDINDSDQVVGEALTVGDAASHAFIWKNDGHPMRDLGTLGGSSSIAYAVNASGQVTGRAYTRGDAAAHAFLWRNDGTAMLDLGTLGGANSVGQSINSSGQVIGVGDLRGQTGSHGFLWRNDGTPMVDLKTLGGPTSEPTAINDSGQITGSAFTRSQGVSRRAVVWTYGGTQIHNLGTLGGATSIGNYINNSGWVVGWSRMADKSVHAFVWTNLGQPMRDLNALIDPADPLKPYVVLSVGRTINDAGDIIAIGTDNRGGSPHNREYFLRGSALALSPRSLDFGDQHVSTVSAAKSIAVRNNTTSVVPITSIALTGSGANQFASTNNCGSAVVAKGGCTIKVTFKPTMKGAKSAVLNVNGGGGGLRSVSLAGNGT